MGSIIGRIFSWLGFRGSSDAAPDIPRNPPLDTPTDLAPGAPRDAFDEYLERLFERAYDEELEKNESVWRTAPFMVAAFGLLTAAIGFIASKIPTPALEFLTIANYLIFLVILACFAVAYWYFFEMLRERTYGYLPNAKATLEYARGLQESQPLDATPTAALEQLRSIVVEDLAATATVSRDSNRRRVAARSRSVFFLICASALAFLDSALIFTADKVSAFMSIEGKENGPPATSASPPPASTTSPAAGIRPRRGRPPVPKSQAITNLR